MTPDELSAGLAAVTDARDSNVTDPLDWLVTSALKGADAGACYAPDLIRGAAAATKVKALSIKNQFQLKFGRNFSAEEWRERVKEAKSELARAAAADAPLEELPLLRSPANNNVLVGHENAYLYFANNPEWQGVIGYNDFTGGVEIRKPAPIPITAQVGDELEDSFDTQATRWLERRSNVMFKPDLVHRVIDVLALQNRFHPPRDYLRSLPDWDRVPRLDSWLFAYCGVEPGSDVSPNHFAANIGRRFLISMVARIMHPGCKADHVLVLEGKTGIGKSSICRALVPDEKWYTDQLGDMESKDASMAVRGVWLVEMADLDALSRADEKTAKRFISQQFERFRLPYGRRMAKFQRQCVFVGTTERSNWMRSETGRRFWPVHCGRIDLDGIAKDAPLLWAEAFHVYKAGERWHLAGSEEIAEATKEQRKRYEEDAWKQRVMDAVESYQINGDDWVSTTMILDKMVIPASQQDQRASNRVGAIMRTEGWKPWQKRVVRGANPCWGWIKQEED